MLGGVKIWFSKMNYGANMRRMVSYYQAGYKRYGRSVEALGWLKGKQNLNFKFIQLRFRCILCNLNWL